MTDSSNADWWKGRLVDGDNVGEFPALYVRVKSADAAPFRVVAIYDYAAIDSTDLSMSAGDVLWAQEQEADWYFATNERGETGMVPKYVYP